MPRPIFYLLVIVAVLTFAAYPCFAQQIQGQVRLLPGNDAALGVPVDCSGTGCSGRTYTDRRGNFRFIFRQTGNYDITVRLPGYRVETRSVTLLDYSQSEYIFFQLKPDPKAYGAPDAPPGVVNAGPPSAARTEFNQGRDALSEEVKMDEAISHLEKAIKLYPKYLEAYVLLGDTYIDNHQLDKAEPTLKQALEIDSKSAAAHFALGEVYRQQKKYTEAEKILLEGLKLQDSWQGHLILGRVYWEQSDILKAGPHVGKALQQKPDLAEGHLLAGNILLKAHQAENALVEFQEYLRLEPKGKSAPQAQEMVDKIKKALAEQQKK